MTSTIVKLAIAVVLAAALSPLTVGGVLGLLWFVGGLMGWFAPPGFYFGVGVLAAALTLAQAYKAVEEMVAAWRRDEDGG